MRGHHAITTNALRDRIVQLEWEHSELDRMIDRLRLKKRKLKVKDNIMLLQLQLEPDKHA